jgi:hypothetical protein
MSRFYRIYYCCIYYLTITVDYSQLDLRPHFFESCMQLLQVTESNIIMNSALIQKGNNPCLQSAYLQSVFGRLIHPVAMPRNSVMCQQCGKGGSSLKSCQKCQSSCYCVSLTLICYETLIIKTEIG